MGASTTEMKSKWVTEHLKDKRKTKKDAQKRPCGVKRHENIPVTSRMISWSLKC